MMELGSRTGRDRRRSSGAAVDRGRVGVGLLIGATLGLGLYALGHPATGGPDPVMAAVFTGSGMFLAFLVAAGSWVRERTDIPFRDAAPPPGWRGGRARP